MPSNIQFYYENKLAEIVYMVLKLGRYVIYVIINVIFKLWSLGFNHAISND